eukprot:53646-Amorphochlora_amoeboformis.AAC.1
MVSSLPSPASHGRGEKREEEVGPKRDLLSERHIREVTTKIGKIEEKRESKPIRTRRHERRKKVRYREIMTEIVERENDSTPSLPDNPNPRFEPKRHPAISITSRFRELLD